MVSSEESQDFKYDLYADDTQIYSSSHKSPLKVPTNS